MKNKTIKYIVLTTSFTPTLTFAALGGVKGLLVSFMEVLQILVPIIFGLSMVYFFWGVAQFILKDAGNDKTREEGKKKMIWGIVALFVFISIYGILNFIGSTLQIPAGGSVDDVFHQP